MTPHHTLLIMSGLLLYTLPLKPMVKQTYDFEFINQQKQLLYAIKKGDIHTARQALLNGSRIKIKEKKAPEESPLHVAARQNNPTIVHTLMTSPHGGPQQISKYVLDKVMPFLLCMKRLKEENTCTLQLPPHDLRRKICSYLLPRNEMLIHFVPLTKLYTLNPFLSDNSKKQVLAAVIKRHKNQLKHALKQKRKFIKTFRTPYEIARRVKDKESAQLLNPKNTDKLGDAIEKNYRRLLSMSE